MSRELVPELHDIGKLIDNRSTNSALPGLELESHYFTTANGRPIDFGTWGLSQPKTRSWKGVQAHHTLGRRTLLSTPPAALRGTDPEDVADVLRLILADHLAASTSRAIPQQPGGSTGPRYEVVQCLWNPAKAPDVMGRPVGDEEGLRTLLSFLENDPDAEDFQQQYGPWLDWIPEDKDYRRAVTTLHTHCRLVGKYYGVLKVYTDFDDRERALSYRNAKARAWGEAEAGWAFRLARCRVTFPQRIARVHDLGVFSQLSACVSSLKENDYVLLHTLDTLWLFLPDETLLPLRSVLKPLLDYGFGIDVDIACRGLGELDARLFEKERQTPCYLQPEMPSQLPVGAKLCVLCQMRPACTEDPDEESGISEPLCDICYSIRHESKKKNAFSKLGGIWEKEGAHVAWIRVTLDYERLPAVLRGLFRRHLQNHAASTHDIDSLVDELRPVALMVDFTRDYKEMLRRFAASLRRDLLEDNIEEIASEGPELLVVALRQKGDALKIADAFAEALEVSFPLCADDSPIRLAISISNAKYPFFEHWAYLDAPSQAINIQAVGRARLELPILRFREFRDLKLEGGRASARLHRASAIQARTGSKLMGEIELLDGIRSYPSLHQAAAGGFSVGEMLAFHKISNLGGQP